MQRKLILILIGCFIVVGCRTNTGNRKATMEFRFRESDAYTVNGHRTPYTLWLQENSSNNIELTLDSGALLVRGTLIVYKNDDFTRLCPVAVPIDAHTQEDLRGNFGEATLTLYVPSEETRKSGLPPVIRAEAGKSCNDMAASRGTIVAELKLWRVQK